MTHETALTWVCSMNSHALWRMRLHPEHQTQMGSHVTAPPSKSLATARSNYTCSLRELHFNLETEVPRKM